MAVAPMPPEFYVPAFGFLLAVGTGLVTTIKILYARNTVLIDEQRKQIAESTKTIVLNSEALRANTEALNKLAEVVYEPPQEVKRRWQQR